MPWPLCDQTDKRYSFVKRNKDQKKYVFKQPPHEQPQKSHRQDVLQKHLKINRSLRPTGLMQ